MFTTTAAPPTVNIPSLAALVVFTAPAASFAALAAALDKTLLPAKRRS